MRIGIGAAVVAAAFVWPGVGEAATCLTPVAADGHEPQCNPYQSSPEWGTSHRSSYGQGSSPYPAPEPGDTVTWQDLQFGNEVPVILQFGAPYPDGRRTVWFSTVGSPETKAVYKLDMATGERIGRATLLDEGTAPQQTTTSGVYNLLTRENHLVTVRQNGFAVYGDQRPGDSLSPIRLLGTFALPPRALCGSDDRIIGITLTYEGDIAFATVKGMVGTLPRDLNRMSDQTLRVASLTEPCGSEEVANSLAADEQGGIYVVSTKAQYRFDFTDAPTVSGPTWRAEYPTGGGGGGTTLSSGSGSTPDVVGTDPDDDKFIVITDGQKLMHVTYFWRDEIPADWKPIKPGYDRRIACSVPVRFGRPEATESISEQSVLTRGYASVVVNNALPLDDAFSLLPPERRPLSTLTSNVPGNQPFGMERIDWDPQTRTCRSVWANPDVSIPNAVPTMSTASGLIYGVGVRAGTFGLEGIDFATGEAKLWVPTTPLPTENSFFAATTIGPAGDVWVGGTTGISVFRGPDRAPPRLACKDPEPPVASVRLAGRRAVQVHATDTACGDSATPRSVHLSAARRVSGGCRSLGTRRTRPCSAIRWLRARRLEPALYGRSFSRLDPGRYLLIARVRDRAGHQTIARRAVLVR